MAKRVTEPATTTAPVAKAARGSLGGQLGPPPEIAVPDLPPEMFSPLGMLGLADELPVMIGYFDCEMRYRFLNKALAEWLELPRSEILGRTPAEITGEAAFREREPLIRAALAGERQAVSSTFEHKTRGILALQSEYIPWRNAADEVRGFIAVSTDVTEQRSAERALRESEARFRRIADSAPVMMWVTRLDRTRDFVNDFYAEFLGLSREGARTYDWTKILHPDDLERLVAESLAGEATLKPFPLEARYRRHDGEYRWLRSVSSPRFNADGSLAGFIGVASDVTLAKEAELELKRQVEERTALLTRSEAQFRAIFETVLEVLVLLRPDGTIIELNRKEAVWRADNPRRSIGVKIWESPTLKAYPQHVPLITAAVASAARGENF
ncbi:MAG: PAS domain S-box protein, partial [Sphingomicrobium sp.]